MFGIGIDKYGYLIDIGVNDGIIDKAGAFFSYNEEKIGQGRENSKQYLMEHPEIAQEIENYIREKHSCKKTEIKKQEEKTEEKEKQTKTKKAK